ncbi:cysteine proteinase [Powellomyces hirtus]|nr:cysteine proteinase [Powellomyces hirtus]
MDPVGRKNTPEDLPMPDAFPSTNRASDNGILDAPPSDAMDTDLQPPPPELSTKIALDIDTVIPVDPNVEEETHGMHEWVVRNFTDLRSVPKVFGPEFELGGVKWRILLFPSGNRQRDMLSVFLDCVDAYDKKDDSEWHQCVSFAIGVSNTRDESIHYYQTASHRFNTASQDWGFNALIGLAKLYRGGEDAKGPFIVDDEFKITVWMRIIHDETGVMWHKFENWDSRAKTGFVGLKNQGATCYMNSVLQSLYFTNYFRKATFEIPTENEEPSKSIVLALQRIFYNLQFSPDAVSTTELTKSFGWDAIDSFAQHDVQEFNRVLQDNLESKMKGTKAEGAISRLFVGKMKSYIRCIGVPYESSRMEDFYDIQLNVKGCKTLKESFDEYVAVETLDGDNRYQAEGYGLQDAKKGVIFTAFPPVLHLQLKRFEYDFHRDVMVKINDRHEYPSEIDVGGYLDEEADRSVSQKYHLHGVLVHSGDLHGGHYCAFIRPGPEDKWFKFDDDRVIPATKKEVFEENFGGETVHMRQGIKLKRFTNAYMLVYVRDSDRDKVLAPVTKDDIPAHLLKLLEEERLQHEYETKEREQAHLYTSVKVLRDQDIAEYPGFDLWNFANGPNPSATFKVARADTFGMFREQVASQLNLKPEGFRLWNMTGRQNKTVRPDNPIYDEVDNETVEMVMAKHGKTAHELRFYLELLDDPNLLRITSNGAATAQLQDQAGRTGAADLKDVSKGITLWLKYYDPFTQVLRFVGRLYVDDKETKIGDIVPLLLERAKLPPGTPLKLFEEVKPEMIDVLKTKVSFGFAELGDGDIICYQRELSPKELPTLPEPALPDVAAYYDALRNRVKVAFKEKGHDREEENRTMILSKKMNYSAVTSQLARQVGADADKIRLLSFVPHGYPMNRGNTIKYSANWTLELAFGARGMPLADASAHEEPAGTLLYEVLGIQVRELENKRYLKIWWVDKKNKEQGPFDILVLKQGKVHDITAAVADKIRLGEIKLEDDIEHANSQQTPKYRVFELSRDSRIGKQYSEVDYIDTIKEGAELYVEEVLPHEVSSPLIQVFHFTKDPIRGHGVPLLMAVIPVEPFSETRKRLQARLGMTDKDISKARFLLVEARGRTKPIEDDDVLAELPRTEEWSIGVDHVDKSARGSRLGSFEKAIKIFG